MNTPIRCDSCTRPFPSDPGCGGHLTLVAPENIGRHWPVGEDGSHMARLCGSCLLRVTLKLFSPSAARPPLAIDAGLPDHAAPAAKGV